MGGLTPVYNGKNILRVPLGLFFYRIPPFIKYLLVSDGTNSDPPFRNTDQLSQIDVKYVFDSYYILITSPILSTHYS